MFKSVTLRRRFGTATYYIVMTILSLAMLYPFAWLISSSLKPNAEIFSNASRLIPEHPTLEHYVTGWKGFGGLDFGVFFGNSLFIAILSTVGMTISSAVIAFGFARIQFKGRQLFFVMMIITMLLPGQVLMIPRFVLFNSFGWVGTYLPMTVPSFFGGAFNIFLIMQFIRGIPRDLDEAAKIDGCSWYSIFVRIMLPLIVPSLVTVGVLTFMGSWEDFMGALLYLNKPQMYTVAYAIKLFNDSTQMDYGAMFAMSVLSLIPILIIFFFFQKQLVEGISTQGLKG